MKLSKWWRKRYLVVFLGFLGYFNLYTLRMNLSVAILKMTDKNSENGDVIFDWDQGEKGIILGAFFYGYILTQILGGTLAAKYGGNIIFGGGIAVVTALCLLTPVVAIQTGYAGLIVLRSIQGLFSGMALPSCHQLISYWAPMNEKSWMMSLVIAGMYTGAVISNSVSGIASETLGWPSVFYIFGSISAVWCVVWFIVVRRSPAHDPFISTEERDYILQNTIPSSKPTFNAPWKSIFTSLPVYGIAVSLFSSNWGFYTMMTHLPSYLKDTLNFELASTGFISGLPYLLMATIITISGYLSDWLKVHGYLSMTYIRRTFLSGSFLLQGISLIIVAYLVDPLVCVVVVTIGIGVGGFAISAFTVNPIDIAPHLAGILIGMGNTLGTIPGLIAPVLTGFLITNSTVEEWRIVFFISAGVYAIGVVFCAFFVSGEIQPWACQKPAEKSSDLESKNNVKILTKL